MKSWPASLSRSGGGSQMSGNKDTEVMSGGKCTWKGFHQMQPFTLSRHSD